MRITALGASIKRPCTMQFPTRCRTKERFGSCPFVLPRKERFSCRVRDEMPMKKTKHKTRWERRLLGLLLALVLGASPLFGISGLAAEDSNLEEGSQQEAAVSVPPEEPEHSPAQAEPPGEPEETAYTVVLHDMDPEGKEVFPTEAQEPLKLTVPAGMSLQDFFTQENTLVAPAQEGQEAAAKCRWYTLDEAGEKIPCELSEAVAQSLELYTYTYRLTLYGAPEEDETPETAEMPLLSLTAREKIPLGEDAFTQEGIQYDTNMAWSDRDTGETLSPEALRTQGLTRNYRVQVEPAAGTQETEPVDSTALNVDCYVCINGTWTLLRTLQTTKTEAWSGSTRYYITAEELEAVYGGYGFQASAYNGERIFPHAKTTDTEMWADAVSKGTGAAAKIPLLSIGTQARLYYVPRNIEGNTGYFGTKASIEDATLKQENGFYQVAVQDPDQLFSKEELPTISPTYQAGYFLYGDKISVTLPQKEGVTWKAVNIATGASTAVASGQEITVTVTESVYLVPMPTQGDYTVLYQADVTGSLVNLGTQVTAAMQTVVQNGSVAGCLVLLDSTNGESYGVRWPDSDCAVVSGFEGRKYRYTFQGWKVGDTDEILTPGTTLTKTQFLSYVGTGKTLTLTAVWSPLDTNNRVTTINFFVNKRCEILDYNGSTNSTEKDNYTSALFSTRIYGTQLVNPGSYTGGVIVQSESGVNAYATDQILRKSVTTPVVDRNGNATDITLEDFPSDETVMAEIRAEINKGTEITIDGQVIPKEQVTTDNFTVRWYVLKYENSDGWHIDGVLVAKEATLRITKTFAGDKAAIDQVKQGDYNITVEHTESGATTTDYTLVLTPQGQAGTNETGYTSYDETTDTYTWIVMGRQWRTYQVKEHNFTATDTENVTWHNSTRYRLLNTPGMSEEWQPYTDSTGIEVKAEAYATDVPITAYQTVAFENVYVQSGVLTMRKIDMNSGNGLSGVKFKLSLVSGETLSLHRKPGTNQYSTEVDAKANQEGYTEKVPDNTVTTDSNGYVYIKLAVHGKEGSSTSEKYYLEESIPTGYEGATKILVEVSDQGQLKAVESVVTETDVPTNGIPWVSSEQDGFLLTIRNRSKLLTEVAAQKDWGDTKEKKEVVVELWCNGARMPDTDTVSYVQKLNAANKWTYRWENLPLFVDGHVANYTLREVAIGNTAYDPTAGADGYKEYLVTYDAAQYKQGVDGQYGAAAMWTGSDGEMVYADHALLGVNNREVTKGSISFSKVDTGGQPLAGAEFKLYSDEACSQELDTATSDKSGLVVFQPKITGTYYLKETKAPTGYSLDGTVYTVSIKGTNVLIQKPSQDGTSQQVTRIVNQSAMTLHFLKTDSAGNQLADAQFTLTPRGGAGQAINVTTDQDGKATVSNLEAGSYRIVETQAPSGYRRLAGGVTLEVGTDGTMNIRDAAGTQWALQKDENPDGSISYTLTVRNTPLYEIPTAGGPGGGWVALLGTLLMCGAAAAVLLWRPREKNS